MKEYDNYIKSNLPEPTEKLYDYIFNNEKKLTDIFVVEAGSDNEKFLSIVHGM